MFLRGTMYSDTRRKGSSGTALIGTDFAERASRARERREAKVAQAAADEAQHRANIDSAVYDVSAGYTAINEAKGLYGVRYQTIAVSDLVCQFRFLLTVLRLGLS